MEILFFRSLQNILPAQVVHSPEKEPQASSAEVAHMWSWKQVQFFSAFGRRLRPEKEKRATTLRRPYFAFKSGLLQGWDSPKGK
jgi:hypothetical protein